MDTDYESNQNLGITPISEESSLALATTTILDKEKVVTECEVIPSKRIDLPTGLENNPRKQWLFEYVIYITQLKRMVFYSNGFYFFNGLYHAPDLENNTKIVLTNELINLGFQPLASDIEFVYNQLKIRAYQYPRGKIPNSPEIFLYENCMVNTINNTTLPISPKYFATGSIVGNFDPRLRDNHPWFDKFLLDATGGDMELIQRIWEFVAYVISPEYRLRIIFCLIGVGGAGKSLLLSIIQELLSPSLVTNMSIKNLLGSRFATSELANKRVCIASDEGDFHFSNSDAALLKRISGGGELMTADVKCHNQISFTVTSKIVIASNHAIHTSAAMIDPYLKGRMFVIPFVNSIPQELQDPDLKNKILAERDSIITDAYFIFQELRAKNYSFTGNNEKYEEMAYIVTKKTTDNQLMLFCQEYCIFDEKNFTQTETLYETFCKVFPLNPYKDITAFSRAFLNINNNRIVPFRKHTSEYNLRGFKGVSLI